MTAPKSNDTGSDNSGVARPDESTHATGSGLLRRLVGFATPADEPIALTEDELFECLSARRRRQLIRFLAGTYDRDEDVYLEVKQIADAFARTNHQDPGWKETQRYYVSFIQTHLPLLDDLELVEYHERPKKVQATAVIVPVADVMRTVADRCEGAPNDRIAGGLIDG